MALSTQKKPAPLTVGKATLIAIGLNRVLLVGAELTLDALKPFAGKTLEMESSTPEVGTDGLIRVVLDDPSCDRMTGTYHFFGNPRPGHIRVVAKR